MLCEAVCYKMSLVLDNIPFLVVFFGEYPFIRDWDGILGFLY